MAPFSCCHTKKRVFPIMRYGPFHLPLLSRIVTTNSSVKLEKIEVIASLMPTIFKWKVSFNSWETPSTLKINVVEVGMVVEGKSITSLDKSSTSPSPMYNYKWMELPHEPHEHIVIVVYYVICCWTLGSCLCHSRVGCTHSMYYTHALLCSRPECGCCL